jgi:hypothetical protein
VNDSEIDQKLYQSLAEKIARDVDRANVKYEKQLDQLKRRMYQYELNFRDKEPYFDEIPKIMSEIQLIRTELVGT